MKIIKSVLVFMMVLSTSLVAQNKLSNTVLGNGGIIVSNSKNTITATIGQSTIGSMNNSLYSTSIGFWNQYSLTLTDVENRWVYEVPKQYELDQNYPNPFNPTTTVRYGLPKESKVRIVVYNILGEVVITLVDELQAAGNYEVSFNASNLTSGVYFYRIQAGQFVESKKMVLMK